MKYLLFATCLLLAGCAYAQEPIYTPMKGNYKFKGLKSDTLLLIPSFSDTATANSTYLDAVPGAMIRCGNDFWMRNAGATAWLQNVNVGNGSSPSVNFVSKVYRKANKDSIFYIINPSDTQYAFTDRGFDTLRRSTDSIYAYRFGTKVFQYKDSIPRPDNPDRINGEATKRVSADMKDSTLRIVKTDSLLLTGNNAILNFDDSIKLSALITYIDGSSKFRTNATNADIYYINQTYNKTGYVKVTYSEDIDLTTAYNVELPGVYKIVDYTSTNALNLPDAGNWMGQTFVFINDSGSNIDGADITSTAGSVFDGAAGTITSFLNGKIMTCYCNGVNYYCTFY